jgi:hypothetical protein
LFEAGFTTTTSPKLDAAEGFVPISMSGPREPFFFQLLIAAPFVFNSMETARTRIASPMMATTKRPPPTAAPMIVPVPVLLGAETVIGAASPARGFGLGESVGPGVSVGVTDGEAPMRSDGVGVGVSVGVTEEVTEIVGEGV